MIYSEVLHKGWILPRKEKYTVRDVKTAVANFSSDRENPISSRVAVFIVKCSAIFHGTDWSVAVSQLLSKADQKARQT